MIVELYLGPDPRDATLARYLSLAADDSSLVGDIVLQLARAIIQGAIPPGTVINSQDLARRFATSRTPIREAIIALSREGLVHIPPRRRPRVANPSAKEIAELYELRAQLHSLVAVKLAQRSNEISLEPLLPLLDQMSQAVANDDTDGYFWANVDFHHICAELCGDVILARTLQGIGLQTLRLRRLGMSLPGRTARSLADHERLFLAFTEGDDILAGALMKSIVLRALPGVQELVANSAIVDSAD